MASFGACLIGKYPRSDQTWDAVKKHQADPSPKNRAGLEEAYRDDSRALIRLQKEEQLSLLTDGALAWDDQLKPYTEELQGVQVGGIERWYETNTFYFTPVITGKVESKEPILPKHIRTTDLKTSQRPWAATLISPYTFSHLAKNLHYSSTEELMFDVAAAQAEDLRVLAEEGCSQVHILDPEPAVRESLGLHCTRDELQQWKEAIQTLLKKSQMKSGLILSYGNASSMITDLLDFPVDYLGFDLARTPPDSLREHKFTKGLMLGALYSDISLRADLLQEEPSKIASTAQSLGESMDGSNIIYITPNHELSTVTTRSEADQRLRNLGQALKILKGAS
jgi:methionine synthase II (cobalamin-independent)